MVLRWWWVLLVFIICFAAYEPSVNHTQQQIRLLQEDLSHLKHHRDQLLVMEERLKRQIHSQEDPAFIERTLIKTLGLVPEGQTKVYFRNSSQEGAS